ncbi:homoserine dehydrogenase-domain-containing protein [Fimicolochytrium jonesii]|uniref:homoserine dehydrogenase-domain-containing protein n=1 Tax=Fimicolochytrium jonesii TaxID=1396493 RepID=UPI0022FED1CC|nr:homoserine dehydrogenase-domain-containing protein [Fimicolochytrium jonesii]KAI8819378.1 homoserine dehydrogenase-domain-containing protein [Fimicolochytrium jonesii]
MTVSSHFNVAVIGPGLVGSEFIAQITSCKKPIFKVIGLANSRRMLLCPSGLSAGSWKKELESSSTQADLPKLIEYAASHKPCVVVDCTSSDAVAEQYPEWMQKGLHIVTPNKKGFSGDYALWKKIRDAHSPRSLVYHESTVGAGLPILSTLDDLIATGDEIVRIEGIFSGTLSYLFNNFSSKEWTDTFSKTVSVAKELGYTEPDPRDDLNGMDFARKVVILGRLAGLSLDLKTLSVENVVPEELRGVPTPAEFLEKLPSYDSHFDSLKKDAQKSNGVLRYVGVIDPKGESSVKLKRYPLDHPFASLTGSDNIIAFTTKRFPSPLIIQGAGAGAAVTAFGMFSDLLKIARSVTPASA